MELQSRLSGRTVLVTGGRGFIGAALCRRLGELGADVVSVNRGEHIDPGPGVRSEQVDLADFQQTEVLFERVRPEVVLHLASHVYGARTMEMVLPTFHGNLTSTVNLLTAAQKVGASRVVLTGSLEEPDADEASPVPSSPYAASKFAASAYGRMFHALFDMDVVNLRVFMVYGPAQRDEKKLVPYTIRSLLADQPPSFSSGTRMVDWVYLDDVVSAYVHAAAADGVAGETVEVGTGVLTSVQGVVEEIYSLMGRSDQPSFGGVQDRAMEQVRKADVAHTEKVLGWKPAYDLRSGLEATIEWLSANPPPEG